MAVTAKAMTAVATQPSERDDHHIVSEQGMVFDPRVNANLRGSTCCRTGSGKGENWGVDPALQRCPGRFHLISSFERTKYLLWQVFDQKTT
jgi:hypothetical protein